MFKERFECIFCSSNNLKVLLEKDYDIPLCNFVIDTPRELYHTMPYNVQVCNNCKTVQTKYIGDLSIIYGNNFAGKYGSIRDTLNLEFANIIYKNKRVNSILEVGAGNGELSDILLEKNKYTYTIIDPSYNGAREQRSVMPVYFEDLDLTTIQCDTVVMSHVFEHFYNPIGILDKLRKIQSLQFVHLALPDLDAFIKDGSYHVLNPEHTFYVTNQFIIDIFNYYGFKLNTIQHHQRHSIFLEFEKMSSVPSIPFPVNSNTEENTTLFFNRLLQNIELVNSNLGSLPAYIWPCSMHTLFSLTFGIKREHITAVLDNSPLKISKYLYKHELPCKSFSKVVQSDENKIVIINGGCYNTEVLEEVRRNTKNIVFII